MLTREERKQLNTDFYTALGLMMQGSHSAFGKRVNWTNYKTNVKDIFLRMHVDNKGASIFIDLQHKDEEIRHLIFDQFEELKKVLEAEMATEMIWHREFYKESGVKISRIAMHKEGGSLYKKETWPEVLTFLKEGLIHFDQFWSDCFDIFKTLEP